jgi:hypothetical protein
MIVCALVALVAMRAEALADLKLPARLPGLPPPPRLRGEPPMRIVRVVSVDPACGTNCPEWISAEGFIRPGMAAAFAKMVAELGGRRLPVLISSHGGSVADAVKMGVLIRERRLAVAVARTLIANCPERATQCPGAKGQATTTGASCASACALVLAGGIERLVSPAPEVGVHQITTVMKEAEGAAHLTTIHKFYEQGPVDQAVESYLAALGIGDPVMDLLRKTPASSIRWLTLAEMSESHLATLALDGAEPMLASGANGLNGHGFGADAARPDLVTAKGSAPLVGSGERGSTLEVSFSYRRGGGTVEAAFANRDARPPIVAPGSWTITEAGGDAMSLRVAGAGPAEAILPRERFCALMKAGKFMVEPQAASSGSPTTQAPIAFDFAAMDGAKALMDEACP